tara:strand:- start:467 stop:1108 length:642 start_codon:yes stop_codon:yes gene_type:complete
MKQFKFGNPPMYVNRTLIRKDQKAQPPAEKSSPTPKNQFQAKAFVASNTTKAQSKIDQKSSALVQSQKNVNPKYSPQKGILSPGLSPVNPAAVIITADKPQLTKTPSENIRTNLGVIDPPVPPITSRIVRSDISSKNVTKNGTKEPQGFKSKVQKKADEEKIKQQNNNKSPAAIAAKQSQSSFNVAAEPRLRRVKTQVNDALSSINGLGGWRL